MGGLMGGWMDGWMDDGWMNGWMDGWAMMMDERTDGWMNRFINNKTKYKKTLNRIGKNYCFIIDSI